MTIRLFHPLFLGLLVFLCRAPKPSTEIIYQVSTLDSLMAGNFDGIITFGRLKSLGDFGLGTFDQINGEMIELDGQVYQVKADGKASTVNPGMKTPYADVTFFEADQVETPDDSLGYAQLCTFLDGMIPDKNGYYAIKIEGQFRQIKVRSEHKQEKPYRTLQEVLADQVIFEYDRLDGTMVGFRTPEAAQGISTTGYHFHFISADKSQGGHVLDCRTGAVKIAVDYSEGLKVLSPKK